METKVDVAGIKATEAQVLPMPKTYDVPMTGILYVQ